MKRLLIPLLALGLSGCGAGELAAGAGVAGLFLGGKAPPVAQATTLDERLLISANGLAETTFLAATMAFNSGALPASQDPDTARDNFCELVTAEPKSLAVITDNGGTALALRCRIEYHLDAADLARKSPSNPIAYAEHLAKAGAYNAQLTKLISSHVLKGVQ